jgi:hypothetical protein
MSWCGSFSLLARMIIVGPQTGNFTIELQWLLTFAVGRSTVDNPDQTNKLMRASFSNQHIRHLGSRDSHGEWWVSDLIDSETKARKSINEPFHSVRPKPFQPPERALQSVATFESQKDWEKSDLIEWNKSWIAQGTLSRCPWRNKLR